MKQLWENFRSAFLRRPNSSDFFWVLMLGVGYGICELSLKSTLEIAFWFLLAPRAFDFLFSYASNRWPRQYEKIFAPSLVFCCGLFALWIAFQIDWKSVAQMRPSLGGAVWVAGMGLLALLFFYPLMWLFDRVFKPFARRTGHNLLGALGFLLVCGVWWSGLVAAIFVVFSQPGWGK